MLAVKLPVWLLNRLKLPGDRVMDGNVSSFMMVPLALAATITALTALVRFMEKVSLGSTVVSPLMLTVMVCGVVSLAANVTVPETPT